MSFLSALLLIIVTMPLWVVLSITWSVMVLLWKIVMAFGGAVISLFNNLDDDKFIHPLEILETLFWSIPLGIISAISALGDIPVGIWDWARYDSPFLAFVASIGVIWFYLSLSNR
jgi:hypothetical protein